MPTLTLEPGVVFETENPDWDKTFTIENRVENDRFIFFNCKWDTPEIKPAGRWSFLGFGAVHIKALGITEAWTRGGMIGDKMEEIDMEIRGMNELIKHWCSECRNYARHTSKNRVLGPEAVEVRVTCGNCGYVAVDIVD